ncbi:MAG: SDR family NAD(P)-dependent oxidoreductase, partial [Oscillibacter sp.]|nr:SDR family NAD(P)-dependent oxidoreductase [Oscillibacter sp.]
MKENKIAIVTGGSSGIGKETAKALAARGCAVYEFSRRGTDYEGVKHVTCDVSDETQFREAVRSVLEKEGRVDILVNNAGIGISGAAEFTENADAKRLLDVNLFGTVNGCRAVIPVMREQGGGRIV